VHAAGTHRTYYTGYLLFGLLPLGIQTTLSKPQTETLNVNQHAKSKFTNLLHV